MIYIVTGHPRSGTSMMMECSEAGGMDVVRSDRRDGLNDSCSDELYRPNPNGLYEPAIRDMRRPTWPKGQEGKAIKVVFPFLEYLADGDSWYHVLVMNRHLEEIRQSFEAAFGGRRTVESLAAERTKQMHLLLKRRDVMSLVELQYVDVLDDPKRVLSQIGWPLDIDKAAAVVDPSKYRFRLELLTVGL